MIAGTTGQSTKRVTKDVRKRLNHRLYLQSYRSSRTVQLMNTRSASEKKPIADIFDQQKISVRYDNKAIY